MTSKGIIKFISHPENSHYSLEERSDDGDSSCTITSGTHFRFTFPRHCRILRHPQNIRKRQVSRHLKSATLSTVVSDRRSYSGRRDVDMDLAIMVITPSTVAYFPSFLIRPQNYGRTRLYPKGLLWAELLQEILAFLASTVPMRTRRGLSKWQMQSHSKKFGNS